jgi:hypothetical protein
MANSTTVTLPVSGATVTLTAPKGSIIRELSSYDTSPADVIFTTIAHCTDMSATEAEDLNLEDVVFLREALEAAFPVFSKLAAK